jgi:hypothetical protein
MSRKASNVLVVFSALWRMPLHTKRSRSVGGVTVVFSRRERAGKHKSICDSPDLSKDDDLSDAREISADEKRSQLIQSLDGFLAATALARKLVLVTRDESHIQASGVDVLSLWESGAE